MKRTLLTISAVVSMTLGWAQTQIGNSGFENWETVASAQEPTNWNSFLSAGGTWAWAAANQMESSTDVRPGSAGTKSCRIWSRDAFGIVANGNVTLGKINMGSTQPANSSNYNASVTSDAAFSEAYTDMPDSIIFWAKFTPNGHNGNARMKATIHGAYDYRDPEDTPSSAQVVKSCFLNFPQTNGWERFAVAFNPGPASTAAYIMVTFTTNEAPGGGAADDVLLIDDIELKYTAASASLNEVVSNDVLVYLTNGGTMLNFKSNELVNYEVFDISGSLVMNGTTTNSVAFDVPNGVYFIKTSFNGKTESTKVVKY